MYSFIESVPAVKTVAADSIFVANAVQILLRENSIDDILNAPKGTTYPIGGFTFKLVGVITQQTVQLLWTVHTSEFGDALGKAQSYHTGSLGIKF